MAGTIVVDRIESDASYASTINVAGQITFSNTVNFGAYNGTAPVAGLYLPTTNNLVFTTASTERMRIDTSGNLLLGATSNTAAPTGYISAANTFGFKNRIINGGMNIWQRGTSFTDPTSSNFYTADRWAANRTGDATGLTVSQSTDVPSGFKYSLKLQRTATNTNLTTITLWNSNESINTLDLAGQNITLSFWVKTGTNYSGGALTVVANYGTGTDQRIYVYTGATNIISTTQVITSTWTRYAFTGSVSSNATEIGFYLSWTPTGTAGADDSIYLTGVQLEKGSAATSFDYRPYSTELALCQRYYYRTTSLPLGYIINVADLYAGLVKFPVTMRTTPTLDSSGNSWAVTGGSAGTVGLRSGTGWGPNSDQAVPYNASSNWSAGNAAALTAGFSAEL